MLKRMVAGIALGLATPAAAQELRPFCPARPSIGQSACIVDAGHAIAEASAIDWTRERANGVRTDTIVAGDFLFRYGVGATTEVQLGWSAFGTVRTRGLGMRERASGIGDVTLALRQNLRNPDGEGVSFGLQPFVTLPTGGNAIGAGDWSAGLIVPMTFPLSERWTLNLAPEFDAAVDQDGAGRHLAYGGVAGIELAASDAVSATVELSLIREREPLGAFTEALAVASIGWQPADDLQLDVAAGAGLNRDSPDVRVFAGIARRF